jgi:hypothetical protein
MCRGSLEEVAEGSEQIKLLFKRRNDFDFAKKKE